MKFLTRLYILCAAFLTPAFALAVDWGVGVNSRGDWFFTIGKGGGFGCAGTICGVANTILFLINSVLVPVLFAVAFLVFLYGIFSTYILHPDKPAEGHKLVLWGIVGFAVMISIWGLVNVVANTFGLWGYYAPSLPTSY